MKATKIQDIETGKQRANDIFLKLLASKYDVDLNQLVGLQPHLPPSAEKEFIPIRRFDVEASAGTALVAATSEDITGFYAFNRTWLNRRGLLPDHLSVIAVRGDSMEPRLSDNDLVLIDHSQNSVVDGRAFVLRFNDELYVKKIQRLPTGILHLISANPEYPPIPVDLRTENTNIEIIGRVVASMHEW